MAKKRSPSHYSTQKNKKVYIQLRDGTEFVDRFLDKKGSWLHLQERGKIPIKDIAVFTHARIDKPVSD
ncbi:MAG: hypothetical protein EP349_02720 [Alphaproteobacteria bacterium]|nr:MAG: hypothetical protein EP349_02720 [Alphaproteobacteria bacterium]